MEDDRVVTEAMKSKMVLPSEIRDESELLDVMTSPREPLVHFISGIEGPLVIVGAGGKMGPSLCVLAKRAAEAAGRDLEVIALSRFSNESEREWLNQRGIRTQRFDALDPKDLDALPEASHVVYLVGLKFGTGSNPELTWATNTIAPAGVAHRYSRIPMVALSTGNVYPMVPADSMGSLEQDPLTPIGEYANAAVARERVFGHFSRTLGNPCALLRLNYALDLRYGILVDLCQSILKGQPIDLAMSRANCIWQGDANDRILRSLSLAASPAVSFNLTSPESYAIRDLAERLGAELEMTPKFQGEPSSTALLSDASLLTDRLGEPEIPIDTVIRWTARWMRHGGRTLGRPTKFQIRDGAF